MEQIILTNSTHEAVSNIDLENGIIYSVKEADYGLNKNGYFFTEELLNGLLTQGNAGDGIKSRFGHPMAGVESLGKFIDFPLKSDGFWLVHTTDHGVL